MTDLVWLSEDDPLPLPRFFHQDDLSLPSGLIALSNEMSPQRLVEAYRLGIFPWYSESEPVMWWCTSPRMVLQVADFKVSRSLLKKIKQVLTDDSWEIRIDSSFNQVIRSCAQVTRSYQGGGTWITDEIIEHYSTLNQWSIAHSVETWHNNRLIGGLYGINLGKMMFGESMFTLEPDASKLALAALCAWCAQVDISMIDCQQETSHLASLGGAPISKTSFLDNLEQRVDLPSPQWAWNKTVLEHWL
ncbi:MAG: leucyl/phenylalanyl-tRNA--protein transferase [Betaproteobacteria bacterium]